MQKTQKEEMLASKLSQKMRDDFGKGPKQVSVYIFENQIVLFVISELLPVINSTFAAGNREISLDIIGQGSHPIV